MTKEVARKEMMDNLEERIGVKLEEPTKRLKSLRSGIGFSSSTRT